MGERIFKIRATEIYFKLPPFETKQFSSQQINPLLVNMSISGNSFLIGHKN